MFNALHAGVKMMVVFRLDAGPWYGLRHAARAAALAESGREAGLDFRFLVAGGGEAWLSAQGWTASPVPGGPTVEATDAWVGLAGEAEVVIVDAPSMGAASIARLRTALGRIPLVVIGDDAGVFVDADVFCRFGAAAPLEIPAVAPNTKTIIGPRYAPVREALRWGDGPVSHVPSGVVALGAWPDGKRLSRVVGSLARIGSPCAWSVLCVEPPAVLPEGWTAVSEPAGAARKLAEATLIVAGGVWTAMEAAVCGVPCLYVDDDRRRAAEWRALEESGYGWRTAGGDDDEIAAFAERLINDAPVCDAMAQAARRSLDRLGGRRVWEKLSRYVGLRVHIDDAGL